MTTNIFHYATKELSQDAFLMWLLNNWNSEDTSVAEASQRVILKFLNKHVDALNIESVVTKSQLRKIDVIAFVTVNSEKHVIAIEDKITSYEHGDQLVEYREYVLKHYPNYKPHFIFYKTNLMSAREILAVAAKGWTVFDIHSIYNLFENRYSSHYLLHSYLEYIAEIHQMLVQELPENMTQWVGLNWQQFALNHEWNLPEIIECQFENYHNQYFRFTFSFRNHWNDYPFLEIRSRDLKDGQFWIRALTYDMKTEPTIEMRERWMNILSQQGLFKRQHYPKQIGVNRVKEQFRTVEDFDVLVHRYVQQYLELYRNQSNQ